MTPFEWLLLISLSMLWGGFYFFVGVAVRELPTLVIVVCRIGFAALILLAVMRMLGQRMPNNLGVWAAFFAMGFLNNALPFSLVVRGQSHVASGVASILNGATPFFTVLAAHVFTSDEKMTAGRLAGVVLGMIGVAIMIGGAALDSLGVDVVAQLAFLGAALSYAFAGVFGRRFRALGVTPMATATGQVTASSLMLLPLMLFVDQPWTLPSVAGAWRAARGRRTFDGAGLHHLLPPAGHRRRINPAGDGLDQVDATRKYQQWHTASGPAEFAGSHGCLACGDLDKPQGPQFRRHFGRRAVVGGGVPMAGLKAIGQIGSGVLDLQITPTLVRAAGVQLGTDEAGAQDKAAALGFRIVIQFVQADDGLAHADEALDDPIERTAVQDLAIAAGPVAGAVDVFSRFVARLGAGPAVGLETFQLLDGFHSNAKFDNMHGHGSQPSRRHHK